MNSIVIRLQIINRIFLPEFNKKTFCISGSRLRLLMLAMLWSQIVFAQLPVDPVVVHGNASIDVTGNHMSITNTPGTVLNWQDFSIGDNNSVYIQQQDASSQILNRITGNNASEIFGGLGSNGGVWLINPHGVFIGENARIDVGSLVTSTLNISDFDFLANNYQFNASESGSGNVTNHGEIRTSLGGHVWLLGGQVHHDGLIQSPNGQIVLAAGQHIEMIDSGAPNLVVRIEAPENDVVNLGHLVSTNGQIDVVGSIVNLDGIERAQNVANSASGNIVLQSAETLMLSENSIAQAGAGAIDLAAKDILHEGHIIAHAGEVSVKAVDLTYLDGQIDVSDQKGTGGKILLETGKLEGMANGALNADGQQGGQIRVIGENSVAFSSTLKATGNDQGGKIEVSGDSVILLNAEVDASGSSGQGGTIHLGGGWQGEGDLPHAREVIVGVGSEVRANSSEKGGEIVVWSEQTSEHHGLLQAQQGGSVELSSKGVMQQTGNIQTGLDGTVLSDSANTVVTDDPLDNLALVRKIVSGSVNGNPQLTSGDNFGTSIALDGDRLAVGAPRDDTGGVDRGAVHLFTGMDSESLNGLTWQKKIASGTGAFDMKDLNDFDFFGTAVALDGDYLAVGARGELLTETNKGAVHLFSGVGDNFSGLTWRNKIASGLGASNMPVLSDFDFFGTALALDGDRLVVGASGDSTVGSNNGAVHLFKGIETNITNPSWVGKIVSNSGAIAMPPLADTDFFGWSLALDGDRLAVGAFSDSSMGEDRGSVHLFSGANVDFSGLTWLGKIESNAGATGMPELADNDFFGWSIALNGNHLAVGAFGDSANGNNRGAVHFFTNVKDDFSEITWVDKLASGTGTAGIPSLAGDENFGWSLAMDEDYLAVGALREESGEGAVYLVSLNDNTSDSLGNNTATVDAAVQNLNTGVAGTQVVQGEAKPGNTIDIVISSSFWDINRGAAFKLFSTRDFSRMSVAEMQQMMIYRQQYKEKIFSDAIYSLELDPSLADVPICKHLDEMDTGTCRITAAQREEYKSNVKTSEQRGRKFRIRNIPQIDRKYIVLFGIDHYENPAIPPLESAVFDAKAVGNTFAERLGYEEHVIRNATRAELVSTLNQLAVEMEANDSVVIYYAGHGLMLENTGHGYWIPSDASVLDPKTWISNKSISEMLAAIDSRQIAVISDSCYSGVFAGESKIVGAQSSENLEEILGKKGVVAMTAGANEPVSDEGRDGHSIFAWYLIKTIQQVNTWDTGLNLFKTIQSGVSQSFPQTPQYGGLTSAGYQEGGDYLFELRQ